MGRFRLLRLWPAVRQAERAKANHRTAQPARAPGRQSDAPRTAHSPPPMAPVTTHADHGSSTRPPGGAASEGRPGLELKGMLELLASVAAPVTVITSVLFYFGWIHTGAFYRYFAIDRSALDLSVRDYVVRSISSMLWPMIIGLVLAALWTWAHGLVARTLVDKRRRPLLRRLSLAVGLLGVLCFITGLVGGRVGNPYDSLAHELLTPLGLAAGTALVSYAGHVYRRARSLPQSSPTVGGPEPRWLRPAGLGLVAVLITINLLWAISYYADALGRGDGYQLAARHFSDRPAVIVYSTKRLFLDPFGGVPETPLGGKDAAYQFRYANLRLLVRSGGKYFLVPSGWSTTDPIVIVLSDNDTMRVEFVRT